VRVATVLHYGRGMTTGELEVIDNRITTKEEP
jgi:hypothetical protein